MRELFSFFRADPRFYRFNSQMHARKKKSKSNQAQGKNITKDDDYMLDEKDITALISQDAQNQL